jgi:hypothetical protein
MVMGGSNMQNACKCCTIHPRQQSICRKFGEEWFGPAPPISHQKRTTTTSMTNNIIKATPTMMAMTAMAETATATATATVMVTMPPLMPMLMMSMTATVAFEDGNRTTAIGQ